MGGDAPIHGSGGNSDSEEKGEIDLGRGRDTIEIWGTRLQSGLLGTVVKAR